MIVAGSEVSARLGENVRLPRARVHVSQEELAFRADVHRNQVSLIESGSRLPRFDTLLKLAAALEVDLDVLSHGITYKPRLLSAAPGEFEISSRSLFDEVGAADRPTRGTNR